MDQKKCAIIYFTRSSLSESRKKKWFNSYEKNLRFANSLISKTRQTLRNTGLDVLEIDETLQFGDTFGDRIANAFDLGFSHGYESLILVGNDTVGLSSSYLLEAQDALGFSSQVFGANANGGVYLIGFQKESFYESQKSFVALPWQTTSLWSTICDKYGISLNLSFEVLPDVNSQVDILLLLRDAKRAQNIKDLLASTLAQENKPFNNSIPAKNSNGFHQLKPLRGPPVSFAFC